MITEHGRGGHACFYLLLAAAVVSFAAGVFFYPLLSSLSFGAAELSPRSLALTLFPLFKLLIMLYLTAFTIYSLPAGVLCLSYLSLRVAVTACSMLGQSAADSLFRYAAYLTLSFLTLYLTLCLIARTFRFSQIARTQARSVRTLLFSHPTLVYTRDYLIVTALTAASALLSLCLLVPA